MTQEQKLKQADQTEYTELEDTLKSLLQFIGIFLLILAGVVAYVTVVGMVQKLIAERMTPSYDSAPAEEFRKLKIYVETEGIDEDGNLTAVPTMLRDKTATSSYFASPVITFDCPDGYVRVQRTEDNYSLKYDTLNRRTVKKNAVDENGKSIIELHGYEARHAKTGAKGKAAGESPLAVQMSVGADYYYSWLYDQIYHWDFPFVSPEYRDYNKLTFDYISDSVDFVPQSVINAHRLKLETRLLVTVYAAANSKEVIAEATVKVTNYGNWQDDMSDAILTRAGVDLSGVPYGTFLEIEEYWEAFDGDVINDEEFRENLQDPPDTERSSDGEITAPAE